jgi:hypothetical protein
MGSKNIERTFKRGLMAYVNTSGRIVEAKFVREPCPPTCWWKFSENFNEEDSPVPTGLCPDRKT